MKTDYMVIGRVRNSENILRLVHGIESKGFSCYNFLHKPVTPDSPDLSWEEQMAILESHPDFWNDPVHHHHFKTDMDGLKNADTIVMLLPGGKAAHMEAGVAHGLGKKMILVGEIENPETLYLMFEEKYPDIESFLDSI
jgi:hypothetical protein